MDVNKPNTEELESGLSKINSAGLVNSALHNLWLDFFRHFRRGQYMSANSDLDCVWTILGGEKGMDGSTEEKNYFNMEKELSISGGLVDSVEVNGFDKIKSEHLNKLMKHKSLLLKKSLFLRRLQNEQGKGTAYYDGDDEDLD